MAESMKGLHRSHRCTEVSSANIGEKVTVMGWVQKRRNLGSLIFIDLRDRSGLLQIVFDEESVGAEGFAKAGTLRSEYVVAVEGTVQKRSAAVNENLKTGDIEVIAASLRILNGGEQPDQGRYSSEIPLSGSAQTGHSKELNAEKPCARTDASVYGKRGIFRDRDSDPVQVYTGRCQRLSCAKPCASGKFLCTATVSAAVQAASDGIRL